MDFILQLTINGLLLGGFYATVTLGFSTIWGVMRLINLAHGEFLLMGAFVAWFFFNPTREQNLIIGSADGTATAILLLLVGLLVGLLISNLPTLRTRFEIAWQRRLAAVAGTMILALILYLIWSSAGLIDVVISMMAIMMIALALSLGFIFSHFVLPTRLPDPLQRRLVAYGGSGIVVLVFYSIWQGSDFASIDPFLALPLVFPIFFALGYVLQRHLFNRVVEGPYLTMLLITFAVSIILQNIGLKIFRADPRRINIDYGNAYYITENLTVPPVRVLILLISAIMIAGLVWFLQRTRIGYAIRAAAQHKMAARLMGINIRETYAITFGVAIALTGLAGAMMGMFQPITPVTGPMWTLRAFAIVALGGLGKVEGVIAGGFVLGLVESYIGGYIGIGWGIAAAFIILVLTLVTRPQGLTGGLQPVEE